MPRPFDLTASVRDVKQAAIREQLQRREMEECTFRPATMERANRAMIERLLEDGGVTSTASRTRTH